MTQHSERARRALAHLSEADPALSALAIWMAHRDGEATRTEGETILYGADFPLRPLPEQVGIAGHHVLHVALRHPARMAAMARRLGAEFDPRLFGLAADAVVNEVLAAADHALPRPAPRLGELLSRTGEEAEGALAAWDVDRLYMHLRRNAGPARAYADEKGFRPDLASGPADEGGGRAAEWRGHVARAFQAGARAGRGVGRHAGAIADIPEPTVPWEVVLRGLVARAVAETPRPSWRRPDRQWVAEESSARRSGAEVPAFRPAQMRDARRPRVAVGLDSSGSIDDAQLRMLAAEIAGIARRTGAEVHVLAFDETVHAETRMAPGRWEAAITGMPLRRGGGTAFADVIDRAAALDAAIAVILTDLDGTFGAEPRLPVLWATPDPFPPQPPFGRVLSMAR